MEEDHKSKHTCKFCYKVFPCGRSLGGHMRSHLINISSTEKKLPPLTNANHDGRIVLSAEEGSQVAYGLRENPKKTRKISDKTHDDKLCKECGKPFHSWKALFGHMKCHSSVIGKVTVEEEEGEDSWSDHDHDKAISDNLSSDNEAALCSRKKKRSERPKRYTNSSSSLTEIDQQEQEEVALSLILLSMDSMGSVFESFNTSSESLDGKRRRSAKVSCSDTKSSSAECLKFKFLNEGKLEAELRAPRKRFKTNEISESEVNSPKTLIKKNGSMNNPFGSSDHKKKKSKSKCIIDSNDSDFNYKFTCIICKKGFASYQALGGHRASHKKFKGCCAPTSENSSHETNQSEEKTEPRVECKKSKDHQCPICFKVFPSGQALGGHKRSHMISDQARNTDHPASVSTERQIPEVRSFLDLNLPAPVEEDCTEFKPWWIGTSHKHQHEPLLGLLSSS